MSLEKFYQYLFESIISDVEIFAYYGWWNITIILPVIISIFIILKYMLLTIPIWLPITLITSRIKGILFYKKIKKIYRTIDKSN